MDRRIEMLMGAFIFNVKFINIYTQVDKVKDAIPSKSYDKQYCTTRMQRQLGGAILKSTFTTHQTSNWSNQPTCEASEKGDFTASVCK